MADNLIISVGADTSKLRADLAIAQAEVRKFGADLRKSASEALVTGDKSGISGIAAQLEQSSGHAAKLKAAMAAANAEGLTFSQRLRESAEHFEKFKGQLGGGLEGLLGNVPLSGKALGAGAIIAAIGEVANLGLEAAETGHHMEAVALQLGVSTGQIHAWTQAVGRAGVSAESFDRAMLRFSSNIEKSADQQRKVILDSAQGLADDMGIVARGGMHDKPKAPTSHLVDASLFQNINDPKFQEFAAQNRSMFEQERAQRASAGQPQAPLPDAKTFAAMLRNIMGEDSARGEKLRQDFFKSGGNPAAASDKEGLKRLEPGFRDDFAKMGVELLDSTGKLKGFAEILDKTIAGLSKLDVAARNASERKFFGRGVMADPLLGQALANPNGELGKAIDNTPEFEDKDIAKAAEIQANINTMTAEIREAKFQTGLGIDSGIQSAVSWLSKISDDVSKSAAATQTQTSVEQEGFPDIDKAIGSLASSISSALSSAAAGPAAEADIPAHAAGGMISGPGTGTSDSIIARVSNGEFINTSRAVDHYGPGFFEAANRLALPRFADGGFVGRVSLPAFAEGGMVSSRAPVHLHLGGREFAVHGSESVVGALVAEAGRQRMTSAGVKPSWLR